MSYIRRRNISSVLILDDVIYIDDYPPRVIKIRLRTTRDKKKLCLETGGKLT